MCELNLHRKEIVMELFKLQVLFSTLVVSMVLSLAQAQIMIAEGFFDHPELSYSADMSFLDGEDVFTGKVYRAPNMERIELNVENLPITTIARQDRNLAWVLLPTLGIYVTTTFDHPLISEFIPLPDDYPIIAQEGQESINNTPTTRYRAIGLTRAGTPYEAKVWISDDGVAMQVIEYVDGQPTGAKLELSNVQIDLQELALFEVPASYTLGKIDLAVNLGGIAGLISISNRLDGPLNTILDSLDFTRNTSKRVEGTGESTVIVGSGAVINCPQGDCNQVCEEGSSCTVNCTGGDCHLVVKPFAVGNMNCSGGDCHLACEENSTCTSNCSGGDCHLTCEQGATCDSNCLGGDCQLTCEVNSSCNSTCLGDDCICTGPNCP